MASTEDDELVNAELLEKQKLEQNLENKRRGGVAYRAYDDEEFGPDGRTKGGTRRCLPAELALTARWLASCAAVRATSQNQSPGRFSPNTTSGRKKRCAPSQRCWVAPRSA